MPLTYSVKDKKTRFESDSKLECELVAIALAFASLYIGGDTFKVVKGKTVIDEVDCSSALQRMREKIQNAKFNKRIPEYIEDDEINAYIAYKLNKGANTFDVYEKVKSIQDNRRKLRKL